MAAMGRSCPGLWDERDLRLCAVERYHYTFGSDSSARWWRSRVEPAQVGLSVWFCVVASAGSCLAGLRYGDCSAQYGDCGFALSQTDLPARLRERKRSWTGKNAQLDHDEL